MWDVIVLIPDHCLAQKGTFGQELCPFIDLKQNYLMSTNNLSTNDWIS